MARVKRLLAKDRATAKSIVRALRQFGIQAEIMEPRPAKRKRQRRRPKRRAKRRA